MKALSMAAPLSNLYTAAIFGALALTYGLPSMAGESADVRQIVVRYGDLNLTNPRGAATLYGRISAAAREVCDASEVVSRDPGARASVDACVRKAIGEAVAEVGRPELLAIYNARNSVPLGMPVASARKR
jgi:UrcA family protein